ncbi:MAG: winged helix-turn-helix domain-containing protein [Candidatus Nanohaloarchaea archaeon]|nr:winged helix-turn-helix domain-containing protein [Candidatus Nanohaloarchaea archaeon]
MLRRAIRRLLGISSRDHTDHISSELEELRDAVLSNAAEIEDLRTDLTARVEDIEEWRQQRDEHIDSNAQAVEHLLEALTHQLEAEGREEKQSIDDEIAAKLADIDERLTALEKAYNVRKTGEEPSGRTSKRPSSRLVDKNGQPTNLAGTAEDAKQGEQLWKKATKAQRSVLKTMYDAGYPMSYKEIAEEVGRSVSTVKNHINNLKAAGFEFKEDEGHNNAKKYMVDDRVKAFLTLRLNE